MLPAPAPVVVVHADLGGVVTDYAQRVIEYQGRKVVVRIDGPCASACTMVTGVDPSRLCITGRAELDFHQAYLQNPFDPLDTSMRAEDATQTMMRFYPAGVRAWIARQGGLTKDMIVLAGAELRRLFRACR